MFVYMYVYAKKPEIEKYRKNIFSYEKNVCPFVVDKIYLNMSAQKITDLLIILLCFTIELVKLMSLT